MFIFSAVAGESECQKDVSWETCKGPLSHGSSKQEM